MKGTELRFGRIQQVSNGRARVRFAEDGLLSDMLPFIKRSKGVRVDYRLRQDEMVAVLMDCDGSTGVIIGPINTNSDPPALDQANVFRITYPDGSTVQWNEQTGVLQVDAKGSATIKAPTVTVEGNLNVTGNVVANGTVSGTDVLADTTSLKLHVHTSAAPGSPTSPPVV